MKQMFRIPGFTPYIAVVLLNTITDLGHKIIIQNIVFKCYEGTEQIALTAVVNALILLPFILLFTPSGFLSDRFAKNVVIKLCAAATIPLTLLIVLCYHLGLFWPAFALTFLLAAQSAIYSPAKYAYLKELVGKEKLAGGNAIVQSVTIVAILAGGVIYSIIFEYLLGGSALTPADILRTIAPSGYFLVAGAVLQTLLTRGLPKTIPGDRRLRLDWSDYLSGRQLRTNFRLLSDNNTIWLAVLGLSIFWAVNQVLLAAFGAHLKATVGENNTVVAQGMLAVGGVGLFFGSMTAGRCSKNYIETGLIPAASVIMTLCLFLLPGITHPMALGSLLFLYGIAGGMLVVPLNALIQFNAKEGDLGRVLAGNNFMQNIAMLLFLGGTLLAANYGISSVPLFKILSAIVLVGTIYALWKLPQSLLRYLLRVVVSQRYNLTVSGLNNIPSQGGVLLLGNHTSFLDWAVLQLAVPRPLRFVMARSFYERWYWRWALDLFHAIPISGRGFRSALEEVSKALDRGEVVALFPEGALSRNGQLGEFKRGFEEAARHADCVIVPFYLRGLWGSAFSFASAKLRRTTGRGTVRDVTVSFGKPLPREADARQVKAAVFHLSIETWKYYSDTFDTLDVSWLKRVKKDMGSTCIIDADGTSFSGTRLLGACLAISKQLAKLVGEVRNVGVLLPPSAGGIMANLSLLMRAKTVVNLNYTAGADIMAKCMNKAEIKTVVTSERFLTRLRAKGFDLDAAFEGRQVVYLEDVRRNLNRVALLLCLIMARVLPVFILRPIFFKRASREDTATILFSSGSEGTPKGVMLSHTNIVGNIRQVSCLLNACQDDVILATLPLFHAFGLTITTFLPLLQGIPLVCQPDPTDARKVGRLVAEHGVTILCGTPTFLGMYARNKKLHPLMFRSLRQVVAGAERLPNEIRQAFRDRFGLEIHEGYGTTETTPVASVNVNDALNMTDFSVQLGHKPGTVGLPLPGSTFRIVDPQTLQDLPPDEAGLILIGGTQIMQGYLGDEERTREALVEQNGIRWYKSGDKGMLDEDGFLTILGRYSRFAKIGGEMVSLAAVEDAILKITPNGTEIVAVAVPDTKKGERIVALVKSEWSGDAIKKSLIGEIIPIMLPAMFLEVEQIPRLGTGKTDLGTARRLALEAMAG
ncbi:MAG: acyl-[ACP]--phospholipid O-acyltransferase [Pedobacter sp.]